MTTLSIPVDDATAKAYRSASEPERDTLARFAASMIRASLASRENRLQAFRDVADATGAEAQQNGWNDELDQALLRGDFDDDE